MRWPVKKTSLFLRDTSGAVAIIFALCLPMFISAAGVAVDLAQAYNVKNRLSDALDKASLAGGSSQGTEAEVRDRVERFFEANYPADKLGTPYDITVLVGADSTVTVSARAQVETTFMAVMGREHLDVAAETRVKRELAGVEAVLVLDVTGSMAGTRITSLRTAANNFINIMFSRIADPAYIKIGIVPYNDTVNVGPYGLGLNPDGTHYGTAFVERPAADDYVAPPSNINYGTSGTNWAGCILERAYPDDTNDDSSPDWGMWRYPRICSVDWRGRTTCSNNNPNTGCLSAARVVPLTNSQATLTNAINSLPTSGNTYGNVGMAWGYHVITPTEPFVEGVELDDPEWSRTIIMMTDGDNTADNTYSAYGWNPGLTVNTLNNRLAETCANIKADGIQIYTITFGSSINATTRDIYRTCATDPGKYFNAPASSDLVEVFENIANQLSQLHIVH